MARKSITLNTLEVKACKLSQAYNRNANSTVNNAVMHISTGKKIGFVESSGTVSKITHPVLIKIAKIIK